MAVTLKDIARETVVTDRLVSLAISFKVTAIN